jgi:hypothetical protein
LAHFYPHAILRLCKLLQDCFSFAVIFLSIDESPCLFVQYHWLSMPDFSVEDVLKLAQLLAILKFGRQ